MAFNGNNMTPLGGNARAGDNAQDRNAPMAWAYESKTDDLATIQGVGYFDTFNAFLQSGQFIYVFSADGQKVFLTVDTVDKTLKQVTMDLVPFGPVPIPDFVVYVVALGSFPDPVAGVIFLDFNVAYLLYTRIETDLNRFVLPITSNTSFESTNGAVNNLRYAGPDTFVTAPFMFSLRFDKILIVYDGLVTSGASLFDIASNTALFPFAISVIDDTVIVGFPSLGIIKDFATATLTGSVLNNCGTLTLENNEVVIISDVSVIPNIVAPQTAFRITGRIDQSVLIVDNFFTVRNGQAALFIDPDIGANSRIIIDNVASTTQGTGTFFEVGLTGGITAIGDLSRSGVIDSIVSAEGGAAILVTTSVNHNLQVFQQVSQTTGVSAYDVPTSITSVPQLDQYILPIPFSIPQSGTYIANSVLVTTDAPHGLGDGQTLLIEGQPDYNGGATIYLTGSNFFSINRTFIAVGFGGTFNTGSLTQTDKRVNLTNTSGVPDSQTIFNLGIISNTASTAIITADEFQNMTLGGNAITTGSELFTLINADTGEFRYDGVDDITISFTGFVSAVRGPNVALIYKFVPAINGDSQESSVAPAVATVTNTNITIPISGIVNLVAGDTIKMQVLQVSGTAAIQITDLSFVGKV